MANMIQLNAGKINLLMANDCLGPYEFCEKASIHYNSYLRITKGYPVKTITAGKIAKALNVRVEDLLED